MKFASSLADEFRGVPFRRKGGTAEWALGYARNHIAKWFH
jgi:hypothetical protein